MRHGARRCPPDVQQLPTVGPQRRDGAAIGPGRLDRSRPPWTGPGPQGLEAVLRAPDPPPRPRTSGGDKRGIRSRKGDKIATEGPGQRLLVKSGHCGSFGDCRTRQNAAKRGQAFPRSWTGPGPVQGTSPKLESS